MDRPLRCAKSVRMTLAERSLARRHPGVELVRFSAAELDRHQAAGFRSQHGQDVFLSRVLGDADHPGTFVDIGCNRPHGGNNSSWLESRGWSGYAFDPQATFAEAWAAERTTPFIRAAISGHVGERDFVQFRSVAGWEHELSGFADYASPAHLQAYPHDRHSVPTGPIAHFVPDLGPVDLVLVDVEGAEMEVLDGIGLEELRPRWLLIENNRTLGGHDAIRGRIVGCGYRFVARIGRTDDFYERTASD
ncbi:MAG: FkbM family methyltransferase [Acidimicrobiales bacterium]